MQGRMDKLKLLLSNSAVYIYGFLICDLNHKDTGVCTAQYFVFI